jgi:hypothetical protein
MLRLRRSAVLVVGSARWVRVFRLVRAFRWVRAVSLGGRARLFGGCVKPGQGMPSPGGQVSRMAGSAGTLRFVWVALGAPSRRPPVGLPRRNPGCGASVVGLRWVEGRTPEPGVVGLCQVDGMAHLVTSCGWWGCWSPCVGVGMWSPRVGGPLWSRWVGGVPRHLVWVAHSGRLVWVARLVTLCGWWGVVALGGGAVWSRWVGGASRRLVWVVGVGAWSRLLAGGGRRVVACSILLPGCGLLVGRLLSRFT